MLLLVLVLTLSLIGVLVLALMFPHDEDTAVHTHAVDAMVASAEGRFQRVGADAPPTATTLQPRWGSRSTLSLVLCALATWIALRVAFGPQQQSRNSRS